MNVRVRILFKPPTEQDWQAMRSLAGSLTSDPKSVRVSADTSPGRLVAEFMMPTEAQCNAVPKIERAIKLHAWNRGIRDSASRIWKRSGPARIAWRRGARIAGGARDHRSKRARHLLFLFKVTLYGLRHLYAVIAVESEIPARPLADLMGHSTTNAISRYSKETRQRFEHLVHISQQHVRRRKRLAAQPT